MFALAPFSLLYGAIVRGRTALYRAGVLRTHRIDVPVVSIGNITTGGTGKTPLVIWVARAMANEGHRPCILTRGYGRRSANRRVLVSDGETIFADALTGGDEPLLLAEKLRGKAAVISDRDRVAAAQWARENLAIDLFILDDGFQHLRLARDLDIVTLDASNAWGNGLLPYGRRREPLSSLARADCLIITRAEQAHDPERLREEAKRFGKDRPIHLAYTRTVGARALDSALQTGPTSDWRDRQPFAAFCALGNPGAFFSHLRREGLALTLTCAFADHHIYTQQEIDRLTELAIKSGARALITTEKDAVKLRALRFDIPCFVLEIEVEIERAEDLRAILNDATCHRRKANQSARGTG
ncbi:tetraacyldisaccharide 4'-kinase [Pyrinomonas methylaliphatogenes]|uniref:Tetraacyldisaccharide 4'-kinase n=1 Tax=Pyrinomonas methylaliphatogenes TaxID=454194 RepID=A0A0B6WYN7_9BACT|nr:tetraacyldisaccharide 4'-kinase [Pyrinomonas methylaliphatogenes]MBX5479554.1 tetraacyldisaccharide 4'-kinase [Pyrinomonas methylaliphatogenes]CDM65847.1 lipid-A-disaccharide kinase [Pyrinomonas methylaliphatogenes]